MELSYLIESGYISTLITGLFLVGGVLGFGWFEYRRTLRMPHLGTVMVKNRLNRSN